MILRIALRRLLRSPALTSAAVITLALGVAANATIFSVVEATLLRPLPYPEADRLVALDVQIQRETGLLTVGWSWAGFQQFAAQSTLQDAAVYADANLTITGAGPAERVPIEIVSAGYFRLLGVKPALGDVFGSDAKPLVLISHALWVRRFASDPSIVGRSITVNGKHGLVVAGVAPAGFSGLTGNADLWVPVELSAQLLWPGALDPRNSWLPGIARLPRGQSLDAQRSAAERAYRALEKSRPGESKVALTPLRESRTDPMLRRAALALLGAVAFLLIIAAANLSNLLLARAAARQRDVAIVSALGASRGQVMLDFAAEAALLAVAGGAVGILLSQWGLDALLALRPQFAGDARFWRDLTPSSVHLGGQVGLMAAAVALLSGLASAIPAALLSSRGDVASVLRDGGPGSSRGGSVRTLSGRGLLVVIQLAVSLVLVLGAGLLLRSFFALRQVEPGFEAPGLVAVRLYQPASQSESTRMDVVARALEGAAAIPGVSAAAVDRCLPLTGTCDTTEVRQIEHQPRFDERGVEVALHFVSPNHLATLGARLLAGRFIQPSDRTGSVPVVVLNQAAAKKLFPHGDPVGTRIDLGQPQLLEVIGVMSDVHYTSPHEAVAPAVFLSTAQNGFPGTWLLLRAQPGISPLSLAPAVQKMINGIDPELAISAPRLLETVAADATSQQRFAAVLLAVFAAVALLLSGAGIYGVLSVSVAQRQREIGIRLALGAGRFDVLRLVAGDSLRLVLAGLAVGALISAAALRLVSSLLYGVSAADPAVALAAAGALFAFAAVATLIPAWRGVRVDPALAMRAE